MDTRKRTLAAGVALLLVLAAGIAFLLLRKSQDPDTLDGGGPAAGEESLPSTGGEGAAAAGAPEPSSGSPLPDAPPGQDGPGAARPGSGAQPGEVRTAGAGAGEISGRVVSKKTSKPLADARLILTWPGRTGEGAAAPDPDGRFRFEGLSTGTKYRLRLERKGYEPAVRGNILLSGNQGADLGTVALVPLVMLRGRVVNKEAKPLAGARVRLSDDLGIKLGPDIDFAGLLKRAAVADPTHAQTRTDAKGAFIFHTGDAPEGSYCLRISKEEYATGLRHGLVLKDGSKAKNLEIVLDAPTGLRGRVVDGGGNPIEKVVVVALAEPKGPPPVGREFYFEKFWELTDREGKFHFRDLPRDRYTIMARREGYPTKMHDRVRPPVEEEIVIVITEGFTLEGRVLDANSGEGVVGAKILAMSSRGEGGGFGQTVSAEGGAYRLENLPPTEYDLVVSAEGFSSLEEEIDGKGGGVLTRDFPLRRGVTISGRVVDDANGKPIPGVRVLAFGGGGRFTPMGKTARTLSRPDGTFLIENVSVTEAAEWTDGERRKTGKFAAALLALKEGWQLVRPQEVPVPGGQGRVTNVEIRMTASPRATCRVVDPAGKPVTGARVQVVTGDKSVLEFQALMDVKPAEMRTDGEGCFAVPLPVNHAALVLVLHPDFAWGIREFKNLGPGARVEGILIRLTPGGSVKGVFLSQDGAPLSGEKLTASYLGESGKGDILREMMDPESVMPTAVTDAQGRFELAHLRPGLWEIEPASEKFPRGATKKVRIQEGEAAQVQIRVVPPLAIEGLVVDEAGAPLGGIRITATALSGGDRESARSAEDGTFRIGDLTEGEYRLHAWGRGLQMDPVKLQAGTVGIRIVMKAPERDR
jgi:uncharacterized GH25 family protein